MIFFRIRLISARRFGRETVNKVRAKNLKLLKKARELARRRAPDFDLGLNIIDADALQKLLDQMTRDGKTAYEDYRIFFLRLFPARIDVPSGIEHMLKYFSYDTISFT